MKTYQARGEIGLGDLVRALHALGTEDETVVDQIAASLGFTGRDPNPPEHGQGAYDTSRFTRIHRPRKPEPKTPISPGLPPMPSQPKAPQQLSDIWLEPIAPSTSASEPEWLAMLPDDEAEAPDPLDREALLGKYTAPGVIGAAVCTRRPGPDLDVPRLTEFAISGQLLDRIPRLPETTLERGIQMLVDGGESMAPFRPDTDDLLDSFANVVGRSRCVVFDFEADPADAVRWTADGRERRWRPEPGRPVVLATDLDIGAASASRHRTRQRTWQSFARRCREARCPLVAFVPRTPDRWPSGLQRWISLIHWDPRTSAAAVRRLVGSGHEVGW
jgi:hypothetical protein